MAGWWRAGLRGRWQQPVARRCLGFRAWVVQAPPPLRWAAADCEGIPTFPQLPSTINYYLAKASGLLGWACLPGAPPTHPTPQLPAPPPPAAQAYNDYISALPRSQWCDTTFPNTVLNVRACPCGDVCSTCGTLLLPL